MRKLEGIVKEIVDEMGYLKTREERFASTNSTYEFLSLISNSPLMHYLSTRRFPYSFSEPAFLTLYFILAVSTNERVQNFAWFTIFSLTALGVWQIFHLRAFFKRKYLID